MRKFLVLFFVVVFLMLSVVPAFAADIPDEVFYHPVLNFDSIWGSVDPMSFSWPFNSVKPGQTDRDVSSDGGIFEGVYSTSSLTAGNSINASFSLPTVAGSVGKAETLTLFSSSPQIVPRGTLSGDGAFEIYTNASKLTISSVRLSGQVWVVDEDELDDSGSMLYDAMFYSFDRTFSCSSSVAAIGDYLNECLNLITGINGQYYVMLDQLKVELQVIRHTVDTPTFYFSSHISPNHYGVHYWFRQFDVKHSSNVTVNEGDFDVVSWLRTAVGSFLDLEIAPGFSIDKIFYLILVVGVLLWFVKLIS